MRNGVDLEEKFSNLDHYRTLNIIDDIIITELLDNSKENGALTKFREEMNSGYAKYEFMDEEELAELEESFAFDPDIEGYIPGNYMQLPEDGLMEGLEPPVG